jgi:hypothetical protein
LTLAGDESQAGKDKVSAALTGYAALKFSAK